MPLLDDIQTDFGVFGDFAQEVSYRRGENECLIPAIIIERGMDEDERVTVEAKATVYVSERDLTGLGLGEPLPHDFIDNTWEVETRKRSLGIWELDCYSKIRPKT